MQYIGYFRCRSTLTRVIEKNRELEKRNIYVQHYPCNLVIDEELIPLVAKLSLVDFNLGYNRARKISIQFLLRISGINQIQKAFEAVFKKKEDLYYLVVFSKQKATGINEIKREYKGICEDSEECDRDINEIKTLYNITEEEIEASKRPHENLINVLKKIVLERISTRFLF